MTAGNDESSSGTSGRKAAIGVVVVAFLASATTAMLAFTASHSAREADAKGLAADTADLRGVLSEWQAQVDEAGRAAAGDRATVLGRLVERSEALSSWKPRTPCGQEARDNLRKAMEVRVLILREGGSDRNPDEAGVLATTLRQCEAQRGRDVDI